MDSYRKEVILIKINTVEIYNHMVAVHGMAGCNLPYTPPELKYVGKAILKNSVSVGDNIFYRIDEETIEFEVLANQEVCTSNNSIDFMLVKSIDDMDIVNEKIYNLITISDDITDGFDIIQKKYRDNPKEAKDGLKSLIDYNIENFSWRVKTNNFYDYSFDYKSFDRKNKIESVLNS